MLFLNTRQNSLLFSNFAIIFFEGILQIYMSARFLQRDISLSCKIDSYKFGEKVYPCHANCPKDTANLMMVASHPKTLNADHFLPLVEMILPQDHGRCGAMNYCMLKNRNFPKFKCKYCCLSYHVLCTTMNSKPGDLDDCECMEIVAGKER